MISSKGLKFSALVVPVTFKAFTGKLEKRRHVAIVSCMHLTPCDSPGHKQALVTILALAGF